MLDLRPQTMKVQKDGTEVCVRNTPYIRIDVAEPYTTENGKKLYRRQESVYLQGGRFYGADKHPMKVIPGWVYAEVAKCSPEALKQAGFETVPTEPRSRKGASEAVSAG